ncbi:hypothetical protein [Paradevosia shaoguanensis]|uniref:Uncharacterized protein n=1 Tax=Paradevosia shaoguanensis TaxID=1335043 RepID=A0AA41QHZ6_9HYPH|nr:hypothetical protein [Paradevosia shaoguanensis]MCF1740722.1 hypothetical protein [Paradevosia shaoguanensis]MCI0125206.1 hypothetical protein [Paradevosia shaoguanensis]
MIKMKWAAELYLGRDRSTALALGPKRFRSAANAIRFAIQRAAPVSLRGAMLVVGKHEFGPSEIARFHRALTASNA